jgi:two-component system response regulator FixJ
MRIQIVEDDDAVAASLDALLAEWGYECTRFATGEAFLASDDTEARCVLLDLRLPGMDGMAVLDAFRLRDGQTPVIVVTGHGDVTMAVDAMHRGAQDFIEKPFDGDDLMDTIRTAVERASPDLKCRERLQALTPRETDVLRQIVQGHQNKMIAHNLGISQKTVELHRARVMDKTGARSLPQLMRIALRGGIDAGDPV